MSGKSHYYSVFYLLLVLSMSVFAQQNAMHVNLTTGKPVACSGSKQNSLPDPVRARCVRVNMLSNTANPGVHINELMVFKREKTARPVVVDNFKDTQVVHCPVYSKSNQAAEESAAVIGSINVQPADIPSQVIIPSPARISFGSGELIITSGSKVVASEKSLLPLAELLSQEIYMLSGKKLKVASGNASSGDILLSYKSFRHENSYSLTVKDKVLVEGADYNAVCSGTASLLQSLFPQDEGISVYRQNIFDRPDSDYRGLMIDVARQWHSINTLKKIVILCRVYKIGYLQLHLTDDQSFTFPCQAYPELATPKRHYTVEELRDLVAFADMRGVTIIPEFDGPGHSTAMRRANPEVFGASSLGVLDLAKDDIYGPLETIVSEMCDIFKSSPYFHIGADEAWLGNLAKQKSTIEAVKRRGFDNTHDLFLDYIVKMNNIVKKQGKRTVAWESFPGTGSAKVKIPKDILIIGWETMYQLPQSLVANGYEVVNASWKPLYITGRKRWSQEYIYNWNVYRWENWWDAAPSYSPIQLEKTDRIIGGQMCCWEMPGRIEVSAIRVRIPAVSERLWSIVKKGSYEAFNKRWQRIDGIYQRLMYPFDVKASGLLHPDYTGPKAEKENWFSNYLDLKVVSAHQNITLRYTTDKSIPDVKSPVCPAKLRFDKTTDLKIQAFDDHGRKVGLMFWKRYEHRPVIMIIDKPVIITDYRECWESTHDFSDSVKVELKSALDDCAIYYTFNGRTPDKNSKIYSKPLVIDESVKLTARLMDKSGRFTGEAEQKEFKRLNCQENLTTGKPVTASERNAGHPPEAAVDGIVDIKRFWDASKGAPQWLEVDLQKTAEISKIDLYTYWDGSRYYQYNIEVSKDRQNWVKVVDESKNVVTASKNGYKHQFKPVEARYVKVNMLKNSANPGLHITELRVFE